MSDTMQTTRTTKLCVYTKRNTFIFYMLPVLLTFFLNYVSIMAILTQLTEAT